MKYITVKDFKTSPSDIWKKLPSEREMVVTNNEMPIALLIPLSDETLEDTVLAVRKANALNAIKKMHKISASLGNNKMSFDEIYAVIKDVRKKK